MPDELRGKAPFIRKAARVARSKDGDPKPLRSHRRPAALLKQKQKGKQKQNAHNARRPERQTRNLITKGRSPYRQDEDHDEITVEVAAPGGLAQAQ